MLTGLIRAALPVLLALAASPAGAKEAARLTLADGEARYEVIIDVPEAPPPPQGWPVVYVLDANAYGATMIAAVRTQAMAANWTGMSDAVVVGIDRAGGALFDAARHDDFTATAHRDHGQRDGGGAERFYRLLTGPVRETVAQHAAVDAHRQILFGHSLGGLFVLHTLTHHADGFSGYIASSPSIWWDAVAMRRERAATGRHLRAKQGQMRLFMSVGQWEARPGPDAQAAPGLGERQQTLRSSAMVDNARAMARWLAVQAPGRLSVRFTVLPGEDHMTAPFFAIAHGARFTLRP